MQCLSLLKQLKAILSTVAGATHNNPRTHTTKQVAQLAKANGSEIDDSKPYAELW